MSSYLTGDVSSFESRFRQLLGSNQPIDSTFISSVLADYALFKEEARGYLNTSGLVTVDQSGKWEKVFRCQRFAMSGTAQDLLTQML